ncbi:MAG: conjugal transfer protein TraF [Gammaproteobacteria bacterium]|nr:conjugal transfer protein TraF [Gammaproteobacteria bacterium]
MVKSGFYAVALAAVTQSAIAAPFAHEARSLGMGNIGVATADIATAPFANPAMLAFQPFDDDFSLLLAVGGYFSDPDGMVDDIDQFQSASTDAEKLALAQKMDGKIIAPEISGAVSIGFSGETYAMAVSARSDVTLVGGLSNISTDVSTIDDTSFNRLTVLGVKTNEIGFSVAGNFDIMESKISVGITPRVINVEAVQYDESIVTADTGIGDFTDNVVDLGDFTTLDVGVVMELMDNVQFGATAKNLITDDVSLGNQTLSFDTELKVGVAYRGDMLTVGADLDLTENQITFVGVKRKNLSVGIEYDLFDYLQLRAGMMKNLASDIPYQAKESITTVGLGLWLGFNLDVAVTSGGGDSIGAFAQAGFKF